MKLSKAVTDKYFEEWLYAQREADTYIGFTRTPWSSVISQYIRSIGLGFSQVQRDGSIATFAWSAGVDDMANLTFRMRKLLRKIEFMIEGQPIYHPAESKGVISYKKDFVVGIWQSLA